MNDKNNYTAFPQKRLKWLLQIKPDSHPLFNIDSLEYILNPCGGILSISLGTLDATHKVPRNPGLPREEH